MPRIQLQLYSEPGQIDIFCKLRASDDTYERLTAIVDTGAAISLFPLWLLSSIDYEITFAEKIRIDQAGIAEQSFEALEAIVTIVLEDAAGNLTQPFNVPAWFADTDQPLIGFTGILDRSVLHIDMPQQIGWLEIDR